MTTAGANISQKTTEGRLVAELLFLQDVSEGEKIKQGINCFRRAQKDIKLSAESQAFVDSQEFKQLQTAKTMSSIVLPKASTPVV